MSATPRTDEAIERWHQGKVNILEELAKLEIELNHAEAERIDLAKQLRSEKEMHAECQNERNSLQDQRDFCMDEIERLRKERDEAREERDQWKTKFIQANKDYGFELMDPCGTIWDHAKRLQQERDAARAKIQRQAERIRELDGATNHADGTPLTVALRERDNLQDQRDFAMGEIERLRKERDEAREKIVALQKQINGMKRFSNERYEEILRVRKERDEAREAFAVVTDQLVQVQSRPTQTTNQPQISTKLAHAPYPDWVCKTCGEKFGRGMPEGHIATWHIEKCDICNEEVEVTEPRDFGHMKKWPIEDK